MWGQHLRTRLRSRNFRLGFSVGEFWDSNSIDHDELTSYCHDHCYSSVLCNAYSTPSITALIITLPSNMVACQRRPRPYTCRTPTVHLPTTIVEIPDVSTYPPLLLIPVNPDASTRLSIKHIHPIEGIIATIVMVRVGLVVPRHILCLNCIFFTSV